MNNIKFFSEISKKDVLTVGGKGASLGEMLSAGFPVPPGFVVVAELSKKFIDGDIPIDIEEEILKAFDSLGASRVAVRSSAIAEDSSQASWAGQLESYLNIDRENLISKIKECWNSIKSERATQYASQQNMSKDQLLVAVVVQKMIDSEAAGVMFTLNPVTNNREEIMIEAGFGLGEMIVQGLITPNNFVLNKQTLEIKSRDVQSQDRMLIFKDGKNIEVSVPEEKISKQVISDEQVKELGEIAVKIENHYGIPQDIEWATDESGKIWILQSRPVTTT